jgi:uncharacterized protein (TIGR02145 family)
MRTIKNCLLLTAGCLLLVAGCSKDDEPAVLDVDKTTIDATAAAATYSIGVTSNTAWTASVNSAATWCTVSPATGTGNGTVTVNIEFYAEIGNRAATVTLSTATLTHSVTVVQQRDTPPLAASTQTWEFGEQTWSDAIRCPECDKGTFEESLTDSQCRSYTQNDSTWYYYNWAYVDANKATMCPDPWRVPSQSDFVTLANNTTAYALIDAWGYGGFAYGSSMYSVSEGGVYWSSTEGSGGGNSASALVYGYVDDRGILGVPRSEKPGGTQVRCVK